MIKFLQTNLILLLSLAAIGCSSKNGKIKTPVSIPSEFSKSGSAVLPVKWWESFNDPGLNELMAEAVSNNFTVRAAWDRLEQAEQIAVKAGADLYPKINYSASGVRTRQKKQDSKTYYSTFSAGLELSYEVDLWGQIGSSRQAAIFDAMSAREDVYAAALTLSANIAKTWYQLAESKQKHSILNLQLKANNNVLNIITVQFRKGLVGAADVYRQQQLVESTRGKLIQTQESIILLQNLLSVLAGKRPEPRWKDVKIELVELPDFPNTGIPSSTIRNRPDIQKVLKSIQAADKRVAVAVADQYPKISIKAAANASSSEYEDIFDDWLSNLALNVFGPLYDAGLRKAEVSRTKAVLSEKINSYGQAVLQALRETEDAINQESYQKKYLQNLNEQLKLARQVYQRTEMNYIKGKLDYIRVLESLVSKQNLEIIELNAQRVLLERRIDLCRAIAGSWEIERPEAKKLEK